jgi:hypothetical protein
LKVGSTNLGTTWQLGATRIDIRPDGRRWPTSLRLSLN